MLVRHRAELLAGIGLVDRQVILTVRWLSFILAVADEIEARPKINS
jgi:hypothetical protein